MKKKTPPPQFELPHADQAFNLATESTLDGDRLAREAEQRARDRQHAEQQQRALF